MRHATQYFTQTIDQPMPHAEPDSHYHRHTLLKQLTRSAGYPAFSCGCYSTQSMRVLEHFKIQLGCYVIPDVWQLSAHSNLLWHYQLNMTLMAPVLPAAAAVSKPVMMSFSEKPKRWVMRGSQLIFFSSNRSRHVGYCTNKDRGYSCSSKKDHHKIPTKVTALHIDCAECNMDLSLMANVQTLCYADTVLAVRLCTMHAHC